MSFKHSVLDNAKDYIDNKALDKDTIEQLLDMHKYNQHYSNNEVEYSFEKLISDVSEYKLLVSAINGHIKRKEEKLASKKIEHAKTITKSIILSAQNFLEKVDKS